VTRIESIQNTLLSYNNETRNKYKGQRGFILATGPSINDIDLLLLKNEICISVNRFVDHPDFNVLQPEFHILADPLFFDKTWLTYTENSKSIKKLKVTNTKLFLPLRFSAMTFVDSDWKDLNRNYYEYGDQSNAPKDIDFSRKIPYWGRSVINIAIMLGVHLGLREVYLVGVDSGGIDCPANLKHFYEDSDSEKKELSKICSKDFIDNAIITQTQQLHYLRRYAKENRIKIYNTGVNIFLKLFPYVPFPVKPKNEDVVRENSNDPKIMGLQWNEITLPNICDYFKTKMESKGIYPTKKQIKQLESINKNHWDVKKLKLRRLLEKGAYKKAIKYGLKMEQLWPWDAEVSLLLAKAYQLNKNNKKYKIYLSKTIELDPKIIPNKTSDIEHSLPNMDCALEYSKQFNSFFSKINKIKNDKFKYVIYGNGVIGKTIYALIPEKIIILVDQNSHHMEKQIKQGGVYSPKILQNVYYDKIIISVFGREKNIINYLVNELDVDKDAISFFQ